MSYNSRTKHDHKAQHKERQGLLERPVKIPTVNPTSEKEKQALNKLTEQAVKHKRLKD